MNQYKIVFSGDFLPGHDIDDVKRRLEALLKVPPGKSGLLYSGREVVLKSGLDEARADAYRRKLATMGIGVTVKQGGGDNRERPSPEPAPASPQPSHTSQAMALALEPVAPGPHAAAATASGLEPQVVETPVADMQCPACGTMQPKRTLCIKCGVDMPRVAAANAEAAEARKHPADASIRIHDDAEYDIEVERPPYLALNFDGRFGRRSYFVAGFVVMLVSVVLILAASLMQSVAGAVLSIALTVLCLVFATRTTVLRFHDFNWSGWWTLLNLIPGLNVVMSLLLLFMPGSKTSNDYGPRPAPTAWLPVVLLAGTSIVLGGWLFSTALSSYGHYVEKAKQASAPVTSYDAARDEVIVFSILQCPMCDLKRLQLTQQGIEFKERYVDRDEAAKAELIRSLNDIKHTGQVNLPVVIVNDYVLVNNPPMSEITAYFGQ